MRPCASVMRTAYPQCAISRPGQHEQRFTSSSPVNEFAGLKERPTFTIRDTPHRVQGFLSPTGMRASEAQFHGARQAIGRARRQLALPWPDVDLGSIRRALDETDNPALSVDVDLAPAAYQIEPSMASGEERL